ncbi:hypothetical protein ACFQ14_00105 [Pseudahrensia aquimaris]|uniref:Uncharacterized protein n=1 Tax=Pseudahrensia aquimaris TaxID=744461 RepID=A0ABW3FEG1_9HYPH
MPHAQLARTFAQPLLSLCRTLCALALALLALLSASTAQAQITAPGVLYYNSFLPGRYDLNIMFDPRGQQPRLFFRYGVNAPVDCLRPLTKARGEAWEHVCKFALENGGYLDADAFVIRTGNNPPLYSGILKARDGTEIARIHLSQNQQARLTINLMENSNLGGDPRVLTNPGTVSIGIPYDSQPIGSADFFIDEQRYNLETDKASFFFQRKPRSDISSRGQMEYDFGARMLPDAECPGPGEVWQQICEAAKASENGEVMFKGFAALTPSGLPFTSALRRLVSDPTIRRVGIQKDSPVLKVAPGWPGPEGFDTFARDFKVGVNPNNIFVGQLAGFWQDQSSAFPKLQYKFTPIDRTRVGVEVRAFYKSNCGPGAGLLQAMCETLDKGGPAYGKGELIGAGDGSGSFRGAITFQNAEGESQSLNHTLELTLEGEGAATVKLDANGSGASVAIRPIDNWDELDFEPSTAPYLASIAGPWVSKSASTSVVYEMDITKIDDETFKVVMQGFKLDGDYRPANDTFGRLEEKMDKDDESLRTEFTVKADSEAWTGQMTWPDVFGPYDAALSMFPRGGRLLLRLGNKDSTDIDKGQVFSFREGPMTDLSDKPTPPAPAPSRNDVAQACARVEAFVPQGARYTTLRHILKAVGANPTDDGKVNDCASATALMDSLGLAASGTVPWSEDDAGTLLDQLAKTVGGGTITLKGADDSGTLNVENYAGCAADTDSAVCAALVKSAGQSVQVSGVIAAGAKGYGLIQLDGQPHMAMIDGSADPKVFSIIRQVSVLSSALGAKPAQQPHSAAMCKGVEAIVVPKPTFADGTPLAACSVQEGCLDEDNINAKTMLQSACNVFASGNKVGGPNCMSRGAVAGNSHQFRSNQDALMMYLQEPGGTLPSKSADYGVPCTNCEIVEELKCAKQ